MSKLTIHESVNTVTKTQAAAAFEEVQDDKGRIIKLRRLSPVEESRLIIAVGPEVAGNHVYMSTFAIPAAMVAFIDEDMFGLPAKLSDIELILRVLGTEGMNAIIDHLVTKTEAARKALEEMIATQEAAAKN